MHVERDDEKSKKLQRVFLLALRSIVPCHYPSRQMLDDDIEEFSISDRDLKSAYDPTRRRGRPNKEEALYGKLIAMDVCVPHANGWF